MENQVNYNFILSCLKVIVSQFPDNVIDNVNKQIDELLELEFNEHMLKKTNAIKTYLLIQQYLASKRPEMYPDMVEGMLQGIGDMPIIEAMCSDPFVEKYMTQKYEPFDPNTLDSEIKAKMLMNFDGSYEERKLLRKGIDSDLTKEELSVLTSSPKFRSALVFSIKTHEAQDFFTEMQNEYDENIEWLYKEVDDLKDIYISSCLYNSYRIQFEKVKNLCGIHFLDSCIAAILVSPVDSVIKEYYDIVYYLNIYENTLSPNSWSYVKEYLDGELSDDPQSKALFIDFLSIPEEDGGSPYVNDFCDAVEAYYEEIGESLPFDFSILPSRCTPECDTDESHKDWYEKVPKIKYKGGDNYLFRYLGKLYDRLVEEKWIEADRKNTFIYRLSGFGDVPFNLEHSIKWLGTGRELGFLILALYNHYDKEQDKVTSPRYSKVQAFFGVEGNIKSGLDKWGTNKTWHKIKCMLEDCGFISLKPVK